MLDQFQTSVRGLRSDFESTVRDFAQTHAGHGALCQSFSKFQTTVQTLLHDVLYVYLWEALTHAYIHVV